MGSLLFSFPLSMIFQFPVTKFSPLDFQNSNLETQYFPNLPKFYKNVKPLFWHLPPSARPWSLNYFAPSLTKHWHFLRWTRETTIWFIFFGHWIWTQAWPRRNEVNSKRKTNCPTFVYFIGRMSMFNRFDSLIQAWVVKVFSLLSEVG